MFSKDSKLEVEYQEMEDINSMMEKIQLGKREMVYTSAQVIATLNISQKNFASLNHSKQVIGEVYKIQQAMELLPELKDKPRKSNEESKTLRVRGNQAYKAGNLMGALRLYTKAICCADLDGEEIAMAYANRSAVTYGLGECENSIEDINHALSNGKYRKHLTHKLFERRAKCFLALSQYQRASADFKQVIIYLLETDIDAEKVTSLKACIDAIANCLGKQDSPTKTGVPPPKLSHGPSSYIESASAAVDIRYSLEMGRHIVATQDIAIGDILAIEKPFASVLKPNPLDSFCEHCKRRCYSSIIPCPSCNEVVFCSEFCRKTSWATYHSMECDFMHHLNNLGCEDTTLLAVRTLMKTTQLGKNLQMFMDELLSESEVPCEPEKAGFVANKYLSDHYKPIHNLHTHMEHLTSDELLFIAVEVSSIIHVLKQASRFFEPTDSSMPTDALFQPVSDLQWNHIVAANLLMKYKMISVIYAYNTPEPGWSPVGSDVTSFPKSIGGAIYPFNCLVNHSCDPDVGLCGYNGDTVILFAVQPIKKGQQIFASYRFDYATHDLRTRQRELIRHFHFTCTCTACLEDWPLLLKMADLNPKFVSPRAKNELHREVAKSCSYISNVLMTVLKEEMGEEQFKLLIQHLTLVYKYVKRPWHMWVILQK